MSTTDQTPETIEALRTLLGTSYANLQPDMRNARLKNFDGAIAKSEIDTIDQLVRKYKAIGLSEGMQDLIEQHLGLQVSAVTTTSAEPKSPEESTKAESGLFGKLSEVLSSLAQAISPKTPIDELSNYQLAILAKSKDKRQLKAEAEMRAREGKYGPFVFQDSDGKPIEATMDKYQGHIDGSGSRMRIVDSIVATSVQDFLDTNKPAVPWSVSYPRSEKLGPDGTDSRGGNWLFPTGEKGKEVEDEKRLAGILFAIYIQRKHADAIPSDKASYRIAVKDVQKGGKSEMYIHEWLLWQADSKKSSLRAECEEAMWFRPQPTESSGSSTTNENQNGGNSVTSTLSADQQKALLVLSYLLFRAKDFHSGSTVKKFCAMHYSWMALSGTSDQELFRSMVSQMKLSEFDEKKLRDMIFQAFGRGSQTMPLPDSWEGWL